MSSGLPARRAAIRALNFVLKSRTALDTALAQSPGFAGMEPRDRAFSRLLAATTLRRRGQIDAVLSTFLKHDLPDSALDARLILETGVAQLLFLEVKPHAAVSAAVDLAKADTATVRYAAMINAILRRVTREGTDIAANTPLSLNLPLWLRESWIEAYGTAITEQIATAFAASPPLDLSVQSADEKESWAATLGAKVLPTGTLRKDSIGDITALPGFADGGWWAQDAGAALPAKLLSAATGMEVLDLCAAPGGKTMQLAASGARVTALDASPKRLRRVEANLARTGLAAKLAAADGREWGEDASFDAILLDAPCSATGTLRRRPDAAWMKATEDVQSLMPIQDALFANAVRLLNPGGRLVICTCSLQPEEGEGWLARNLPQHEDLTLDPVLPEELPALEAALRPDGTVRLTPALWADRGGIDGFFIARLRKSSHG
ncbi:RsmB/NOP family class I SAM-dependent RNA methyltransferase [Hyphobacterium sp.]|uniref:RsmB/NOP family class I SAM-dependent RNA methyltransferase n=1 Tax=Hyphobacterium sp. TaxID=2004662 RepID=UPI003BA9FC60